MRFYFRLQFLIFRRQIEETGLHFIAGLLILAFIYLFLFLLIRAYPQYTPILVLYLALSMLYRLNTQQRVDFLKSTFLKKQYRTVRLLENTLCVLPFIPLLVYSQQWWELLVLLVLPFLFLLDVVRGKVDYTIYTPFKSTAFEFIILFRKFWLFVLLTYIVCVIGLYYENSMLCIMLMVGVVFFAVSAYDLMEEEYVLWNYTLSPKAFIKHKLRVGAVQLSILLAPMLLMVSLFDPGALLWGAVAWAVGVLLIVLTILMKYSVYPRRVGIVEIVQCIPLAFIPFLIIAFFPFYYRKAAKNLENYL